LGGGTVIDRIARVRWFFASISDVRPSIVACDLDGTLLRSDGTACERTRLALAEVQAAGALLVLCTGRPTRWMRPVAESIGCSGVAICVNGAVLWDMGSESTLEEFPLQPEVAAEVVALLEEAVPGGAWAVERSTGFAHDPAYVASWSVPPGTMVAEVEALIATPVVKLMLRHGSLRADQLLVRAREAVGDRVEMAHSNAAGALLEISASGVNKGTALMRFCERRAISSEQVIAFGDMPNDVPMLRWAGHAVAVANAHPDVLAIADEVTAANDDAGVAAVLERVFRGNPR
jgi:Cof subfamily protein (haloacid dehalogenase superfamily)